jgi:hypothetical protein
LHNDAKDAAADDDVDVDDDDDDDDDDDGEDRETNEKVNLWSSDILCSAAW